jgi:hypothetical protein
MTDARVRKRDQGVLAVTGKIDEVLQAAVARADVPGVVALAAGDDGVIYEGAAGKRAVDAGDPITPDTMLRIASMTKMVTTTAACNCMSAAAWIWTPQSRPTARNSPACRCSRASTATLRCFARPAARPPSGS